MRFVNAAPGAVLVLLQALSVIPPVLGGGVIPLPAIGALHGYYYADFSAFLGHNLVEHLGNYPRAHGPATFSNGEVEARLHGDGVH